MHNGVTCAKHGNFSGDRIPQNGCTGCVAMWNIYMAAKIGQLKVKGVEPIPRRIPFGGEERDDKDCKTGPSQVGQFPL